MKRICLALAAVLPLLGCSGGGGTVTVPPPPPPPPVISTISMSAAAWNIRYSPQMPPSPSAAAGGWSFAFPVAAAGTCPAPDTTPPNFNVSPCSHVDYVTTPFTAPITGSALSMTFSVSVNGAVFDYHTQPENTCSTPASVRLLIEHAGDSAMTNPVYRWWSNPVSFALAPTGAMTLTVPLSSGSWSDVNGQLGNLNTTTEAGFAAALASPGALGMTFGGGCFFGHGVYLDAGAATFTVTSFQINK